MLAGVSFASGTFAPALLMGDYNDDGTVDAADYVTWREGLGTDYMPTDYDVWRGHFGQTASNGAALRSAGLFSTAVPEPATGVVAALVLSGWFVIGRRRRYPVRRARRDGR